jgi:hypothetical protein
MSALDHPKRTKARSKSRGAVGLVLASCTDTGGVGSVLPRFRTFQVGPKDFWALLRQVEAAVD